MTGAGKKWQENGGGFVLACEGGRCGARGNDYLRGAEEDTRRQENTEKAGEIPASGRAGSKHTRRPPLAKSLRTGRMTMLVASSEAEDEACVGHRAVLIGVEIARAHGVCAKANRPALFEGQVNAAA
jgi:hypothetical protein